MFNVYREWSSQRESYKPILPQYLEGPSNNRLAQLIPTRGGLTVRSVVMIKS